MRQTQEARTQFRSNRIGASAGQFGRVRIERRRPFQVVDREPACTPTMDALAFRSQNNRASLCAAPATVRVHRNDGRGTRLSHGLGRPRVDRTPARHRTVQAIRRHEMRVTREQSSARASERNCFVVSMAACCESLIVGDGNARVSIAVVNQTLNQGLRAGRRLQCDSAKIEPALAETATGQARRQPKDPDFRPHGLASAATA